MKSYSEFFNLQSVVNDSGMKKKVILTGFLLLIAEILTMSQVIIRPNYTLKSHETLNIEKIEILQGSTVFHMSIENRIPGGYFCADRNIFIVYPDGTRTRLVSSKGIPVCPQTHRFKKEGEKLEFTLTFQSLKKADCIDLIEECSDNCFAFYGIVLKDETNKLLNEVFAHADTGELTKALDILKRLNDNTENPDCGITGIICLTTIKLAREAGNEELAAQFYRILNVSKDPRRDVYLNHLNSLGIRY